MVGDAFLELLLALFSFISTASDSLSLRLSDRLIVRADRRQAEQLVVESARIARERVRS
jgi:hypothetical protein